MAKWSLDQFDWSQVTPALVDDDILRLVKTASLVEYNSADYTAYLKNVFPQDRFFHEAADEWGVEEKQHGLALKKWAEIVDPSFDFESSLARFKEAFRIDVTAKQSVRGSQGRELIARCVVEAGTTSYYSALRDATEDPVLKDICHWIAMDEIRHYNLFYKYFEKYQPAEKLGLFDRLRVVLERSGEVDDEELSFAYAAANFNEPVDPKRLPEYSREYMRRAYGILGPKHLTKAMSLMIKAIGISPHGWLVRSVAKVSHALVQRRSRKLGRTLELAHG